MRRAREPDPRIARVKEAGNSGAPPGTPQGEIDAALETVAVRSLRFHSRIARVRRPRARQNNKGVGPDAP